MQILALFLLACGGDADDSGEPDSSSEGIAALGGGSNDLARVQVTVIATDADGLDVPRDLEFDPAVPGLLWIVNQDDDSVTLVFDADTDARSTDHIIDPYALHFMEEVSSLSMGAPGTFGTCQESRNTYNDEYQANDFMGPTLWSTDLEIFGQSNPSAVDYLTDQYGFPVDLGSHLDMQHETPQCMGIAWEVDNAYWVFDGSEGAIERVDFHEDHGAGFDDHSDGETATYVEGQVDRVEGVPSHLVYDHDSALLYIADSGNGRIAVLDTTTGTQGEDRRVIEPGTEYYYMDDASLWTLVDGAEAGFSTPSGLALHEGVLYVTDHDAGAVLAFDLEGKLLDRLDLGVEGLMGIEVRGPDDLWLAVGGEDQVIRLQPAG